MKPSVFSMIKADLDRGESHVFVSDSIWPRIIPFRNADGSMQVVIPEGLQREAAEHGLRIVSADYKAARYQVRRQSER